MKYGSRIVFLLGLVAVAAWTVQAQTPAKVDYAKVLGPWSLEINAGDQYYYLTLVLKMDQGKFTGALSEQNGIFTNVPLTSAEFDGETLKFECKVTTPPDGAERVTKSEAKLVDNKLLGVITIVEFGMSATYAGTKK
jgi:hypothetical protein